MLQVKKTKKNKQKNNNNIKLA